MGDLQATRRTARFGVAGFVGEIASTSAALIDAFERKWSAWRTHATPTATIEAVISRPMTRVPGVPPPMPEVRREPSGQLHVVGDGFDGWGQPDATHFRIEQADDPIPAEAVFKIALAMNVLSRGGMLLHSVGLAFDRRAAVFVGPSGAGKSTLGALCQGSVVSPLSDELVALLPVDDGAPSIQALATPWNVGRGGGATLHCLGTLRHAAHAAIAAGDRGPLLREVLANTLVPDPDPAARARAFRIAARVVNGAQPVCLSFAREASVAAVVSGALAR